MQQQSMHYAYLSLGSNLGERSANLHAAITHLVENPHIQLLATSSFYETAPWGKTDQPAFLNAAIALTTILSPEALLRVTQSIELALGRERHERWGPRIIDIDILFYEGEERRSAELTIPHPYLTQREFVLRPLAEIAPELCVHGKTIREWSKLKSEV